MAKRKITTTEIAKTFLIKPKEIFKNELLDRIKIGELLYSKPLTGLSQLNEFKSEVFSWGDINREIIKRAFNNHYSEYYNEYAKLNTGSGLLDYFHGVDTDDPSYRLQQAKRELSNSISWLNDC